jgi:hypothetical protein
MFGSASLNKNVSRIRERERERERDSKHYYLKLNYVEE